MEINEALIERLLGEAKNSERLRQNFDLRTSENDGSQRMLNAMQPGTVVPVHRHPRSNENVILIKGVLDEVLFDENGNETMRVRLDLTEGKFGYVIPAGVWHTVDIIEPCVIYEAKDGPFGNDGSERKA